MTNSKPPRTYEEFVKRYPKLGQAWVAMREAEQQGPFDERTARLIKLAVAVGAFKEGAVHSAARKALAAGVTRAEMEQVIALAAATLGLPSTVAVDTWVQEILS